MATLCIKAETLLKEKNIQLSAQKEPFCQLMMKILKYVG